MGAKFSAWRRRHPIIFWICAVIIPIGIIVFTFVSVWLIFTVDKKRKAKKFDDEHRLIPEHEQQKINLQAKKIKHKRQKKAHNILKNPRHTAKIQQIIIKKLKPILINEYAKYRADNQSPNNGHVKYSFWLEGETYVINLGGGYKPSVLMPGFMNDINRINRLIFNIPINYKGSHFRLIKPGFKTTNNILLVTFQVTYL